MEKGKALGPDERLAEGLKLLLGNDVGRFHDIIMDTRRGGRGLGCRRNRRMLPPFMLANKKDETEYRFHRGHCFSLVFANKVLIKILSRHLAEFCEKGGISSDE